MAFTEETMAELGITHEMSQAELEAALTVTARELRDLRAARPVIRIGRLEELALSLEHGLHPLQREAGAELRKRLAGG